MRLTESNSTTCTFWMTIARFPHYHNSVLCFIMRNAASFLKIVGQTTEIGGRMGVSDKNQIKRGKKGIYFKKGRGGVIQWNQIAYIILHPKIYLKAFLRNTQKAYRKHKLYNSTVFTLQVWNCVFCTFP